LTAAVEHVAAAAAAGKYAAIPMRAPALVKQAVAIMGLSNDPEAESESG